MTNLFAVRKSEIKVKTIITALAVISAVALPQLFHAIGLASGLGATVGAAFLPMHLPVLLAGFIAGPVVGIIAGIISPLVSYAISGMPMAMILPFIIIELAGYGLCAGLLSKSKMNIFGKLIIVQLAGRALRAGAILFAIYVLGNHMLQASQIINMITTGLFGIIIQLAIIPLLIPKMEGLKKHYE